MEEGSREEGIDHKDFSILLFLGSQQLGVDCNTNISQARFRRKYETITKVFARYDRPKNCEV